MLKVAKNTPSENVYARNYLSLVVNLLGDILVKKSVAVWQRRNEILRTVSLSRTHISLKIIVGCPWIKLSHGAVRTPTTQGLVEWSNKTWKENMRSTIMGSNNENIERWCEYTTQASHTMNITPHRAINTKPYEAVFGSNGTPWELPEHWWRH